MWLAACLALLGAGSVAAQPPNGAANFRVFLKGAAIGGEEAVVRRTPEGVTITSNGRLGAPLDLITRQCVVRYDADWRPIDLAVDAVARGAALSIRTTFAGGQASNEVTQAGAPTRKTDAVAPDTIVLPNLFFSSYEALAMRLAAIPDGASFKVYIAPQAEITVKQNARSTQRIETARRVIEVRAYALTFQNPGAPLDAIIWTDEIGRLLKLEVAAQSLIVVREDLASVATRSLVVSREGDQPVRIPGNGFHLAGTLSQPSGTPPEGSKGRFPAVILVGGSGPTDRDETVSGIAVFGMLASPLADAGYHVLRYDKRGVGQSGGRGEAATLEDYAEDVRAAVKFLRSRKDIDPDRIVLFGHSEGALVALLAASRDEDIAGVAMAAGPSGSGGELVLEQQQYLLGRMNLPEAERAARIDLQKRIQAAVLGQGTWDGIPEPLRRQADTPWFLSFLRFTPAAVIPKVKQPILILQGDLDRQVPAHHADTLAGLARARKKAPADAVTLFKLDGVNHLLVPATTGDMDEYRSLTGRALDPRVAKNTVEWLKKVLPPRR
jgi:pimeloyl-ACP methyl ester carboxylesterase